MHPGAFADDLWLLSRVESLLDCLTDESKIQKKKFGSKAKRELSRDFVSVIRGVRPAFMLDYAPLMTKEDIELISKEINEDVLIPLSRGRGGEEEIVSCVFQILRWMSTASTLGVCQRQKLEQTREWEWESRARLVKVRMIFFIHHPEY